MRAPDPLLDRLAGRPEPVPFPGPVAAIDERGRVRPKSTETPDATTFLFTDIVQSVWQWETSPDMGQRVDRHLRVLRAEVELRHGEVFSVMGDGIAAAFPSAGAAVEAAIAAQLAMPTIGLAVRMGLHTDAIARTDDDDFRGPPVNRAARIMALAQGGQILVSDTAARLVASDLHPTQLRPVGVHHLRGILRPHRLWSVEYQDPRLQHEARSRLGRGQDVAERTS